MANRRSDPPKKKAAPAAKKSAPRKSTLKRGSSAAAEHGPHKPEGAGSTPAPATTNKAPVAQPGERPPRKRRVAGSNPARGSTPEAPATPTPEAAGTAAKLLAATPHEDPEAALNPRVLAFANEYLRTLNGTASYMHTHPGCKPNTAATESCRMLRNPKVRAYIEDRREKLADVVGFGKADVIRELVAIALADPNELSQMRQVSCDECWPKDKDDKPPPMWLEPNPECEHCHGQGVPRTWYADTRKLSPAARRLFAGVKITRQGMEILRRDQDGALDKLAKVFGAYELDNAQKAQPFAEAMTEFVGQLHRSGKGRLQPVAPAARPKAGA